MGIISGSIWGSFQGRFGDHFRVGDHFGVGIISGAVHITLNIFVISKTTAKSTQLCSWWFCLLATLLLGFIEYQIQKNIYDQSKITLCLAILVRVTRDTNSDKTSNSLRGGLLLHEKFSGCDLLFRGPNELFYFFFTSVYRHFVYNFALLTKLLHFFQINTDFIL